MNTWICRILTVVFFINTLPQGAWAERKPAPKFNQQALAQKVENARPTEDQLKQEKAELEATLANADLSPREREFTELELQIANTRLEWTEAVYNAGNNLKEINERLARLYTQREKDLISREAVLEKQEALNDFYQQASSLTWIGAAVAAMHLANQRGSASAEQQDAAYNQEKSQLDLLTGNVRLGEFKPTSSLNASSLTTLAGFEPSGPSVLDLWEKNEIDMEDLLEYLDPISSKPLYATINNTSEAAELLYIFFLSFNSIPSQLTGEEKDNAVWMAKRIKIRAIHQLFNLKGLGVLETRANLTLLLIQVDAFLKANYHETEREQKADRERTGYDMLVKELNEGLNIYLKEGSSWSTSASTQIIYKEILARIEAKPSQDSAEYETLRRELSVAVNYLFSVNEQDKLTNLLVQIDKDGKSFHDYHEALVTEFFSAIYNFLLNIPTSHSQQAYVKELLRVAASSKAKYGNGQTVTNAVNVRVQALAMASMLKQASDTHTIKIFETPKKIEAPYLEAGLFTDFTFRQAMADYTVEVYAPTVEWNVGRRFYSDIREHPIERYGMALDELQELSNHLTFIFKTFLPVYEPNAVWIKEKVGQFTGCSTRQYLDSPKLMQVHDLLNTDNGNHWQINPVFADGTPNENIKCADHPSVIRGIDTVIVWDSTHENKWGMKYTTPSHDRVATEDMALSVMWDAFTWYMWGAVFKGLSYAYKASKALLIATRTASKAHSGFKLARFESKFSQVWKYSTGAWQRELGVASVTKGGKNFVSKLFARQSAEGEYYVVKVVREGFTEITLNIPAKGIALRTLKGRALLNRAIQRELQGIGKTAGRSTASTVGKAAGATKTTLDKAAQATVRNEQHLLQAVETELASGRSFKVVETSVGKIVTPAAGKLITPGSALPKNLTLDAATNNLFNASGEYVGTVLSAGEEATQVAGAVTKGLVQGQGTLSPSIVGRYLTNTYPITKEMWGITKLMITFKVADPIVYNFYTKPYNEDFAKRQDEYFSKKHGVDQEALKAKENEPAPASNVLADVQSLQTHSEDYSWAAFSAIFLGANQALNTFLPEWAQGARRWLFKTTEQVIEADPLKKALPQDQREMFPTPLQVALMPAVLAGDPTPVVQDDGSATDEQYRMTAHNQRLQKAMDSHDVKEYQASTNKEIEAAQKDLDHTLKDPDMKLFLQAIPTGVKEMKAAYNTYIQALKASNQVAETNVKQAIKDADDTLKKFFNTKADILTRGIKAFLANEKVQTLAAQRNVFEQNFPNYFSKDKKAQDRLTSIIDNYYKKREEALIAFYTADNKALKTRQNAAALQEAAAKQFDAIEKEVRDELNALQKELSKFFWGKMISTELEELTGDEDRVNSLKSYLADENVAAFLANLPDGVKLMKQVYKTYEQELKRAKGLLDKDPETAIQIVSEAKEKFHNSRVDLLCQGIDNTAKTQMEEATTEWVDAFRQNYSVFFLDENEAELITAIETYWTGWSDKVKKIYRLEITDLSDEELENQQQILLLELQKLDDTLQQTIDNVQDTCEKRVQAYDRTLPRN